MKLPLRGQGVLDVVEALAEAVLDSAAGKEGRNRSKIIVDIVKYMVDCMQMKTKARPSSPVRANDIAVFRRFNRMYTRYIGTLSEGFLDSNYSLAEGRVLFELATSAEPSAKAIADALEMDPGYLSRLLRKFERSGLLTRRASVRDARFAEIALTLRGKSAFKTLNTAAEKQARTALESLPKPDRTRLIGCMQTVEALFAKTEGGRQLHILRTHRVGDMGWIVHSEGLGYAEEYGWNEAFEALVARIVDDFITHFDASRERCWIAETDGRPVGHIFLVKHPEEPQTARLRLLFVDSSARGVGLGDALVKECIRFARSAGYRKITLWTQSILAAAHRIYERAGFILEKEEHHHSFGKDLVGQTWGLDLMLGDAHLANRPAVRTGFNSPT